MPTDDYKKGLSGDKPGFIEDIFSGKDAIRDQERGYQDYLRNKDLAKQVREQTREDDISSSSSYSGGSGYVSAGGGDTTTSPIIVATIIIGAIGGAIFGFMAGGIGGAIAGLFLGPVVAGFLAFVLFVIWELFKSILPWLIIGIVILVICGIISLLWGVGR